MSTKGLFEMALHIVAPWFISKVEFNVEETRLDIHVDFKAGSKFSVSSSENETHKVYDTKEKTWRHLNFFEHECYLHCRVPRVKTSDGIKQVSPPWAGLSTGFTLLFEALLVQMCLAMPVNAVSRLTKCDDNKIWRLLDKYVEQARAKNDYSGLTALGMDETSRRKGHSYITLFVDLFEKRTLYIAEGKDHKTVKEFSQDLTEHNGKAEKIIDVSCDMSPAFIKGVSEVFPAARITFDKFHVMKLINKAVDAVRREEAQTQPCLKNTRYLWLKNETNLTVSQKERLKEIELSKLNLKTFRALRIREAFQEIYHANTESEFETLLNKWYFWATHSRLEPIKKVAKTIKRHWEGILAWKSSLVNNGVLEGLNSVIQAAKGKARGYKTMKNLKIIAYLLTGKLLFHRVNPYITDSN